MSNRLSYFICGTVSAGTTLLCEALSATELAGKPNEYFFHDKGQLSYQNWDISDYNDYIKRVYEATSTPNSVFGAKILGGHLKLFLRQLWSVTGGPDKNVSMHQRFEFMFPNPHFVWVTRRNKIRQAVELSWAIETGQWVWTKETQNTASTASPEYHFESIDRLLQEIIIWEALLQDLFSELSIQPFVVVYEDFIEYIEETSTKILDFLGIVVPNEHQFRERKLRVPESPLIEDWVSQFRHDKQAGWQTKYW